LIGQQLTHGGGWNIIAIALNESATVKPIVQDDSWRMQPRLSTDGRWLASRRTSPGGLRSTFRRSPPGGRVPAFDRGSNPRWRREGKELFYVRGDDASVMSKSTPTCRTTHRAWASRACCSRRQSEPLFAGSDYVPALDGQRFLRLDAGRVVVSAVHARDDELAGAVETRQHGSVSRLRVGSPNPCFCPAIV